MKLEGPSRLPRLCFFSWDMDRAVVVLAVAVVLVSSGGTPDLVELGSAAMCLGFCRFFLKTVPRWFFSSRFPYKPDAYVLCLYRFQPVSRINWSFRFSS